MDTCLFKGFKILLPNTLNMGNTELIKMDMVLHNDKSEFKCFIRYIYMIFKSNSIITYLKI